jgi:hypothetical protein
MRGQERKKFPMGIDEPMRGKKVSSIFSSVNQKNPKINNGKSKE